MVQINLNLTLMVIFDTISSSDVKTDGFHHSKFLKSNFESLTIWYGMDNRLSLQFIATQQSAVSTDTLFSFSFFFSLFQPKLMKVARQVQCTVRTNLFHLFDILMCTVNICSCYVIVSNFYVATYLLHGFKAF